MKVSYKYLTLNLPLCCLRYLKRRMRWVRAAGCIVADPQGNLLLICRNNRWDLPKGKVEAGETLAQAALRETLEETGIRVLPNPQYPQPTKTPQANLLVQGLYRSASSTRGSTSRRGHHPNRLGHPFRMAPPSPSLLWHTPHPFLILITFQLYNLSTYQLL